MREKNQISPQISPEKNLSTDHSHHNFRTPREFNQQYFQLIREGDSQEKIEQLLIKYQSMINENLILHLHTRETKVYEQFKYNLLCLSLAIIKKQEYSKRWSILYEIINQILKIPNHKRKELDIENTLVKFTIFLIDKRQTQFFLQFPKVLQFLKSSNYFEYANVYTDQSLMVKRVVRIFNSFLCLKFVNPGQLILISYYFAIMSRSYGQYLQSIEEKFAKRLKQYETASRLESQEKEYEKDSFLTPLQIYELINIFYEIDPEGKLKSLLKQELGQYSNSSIVIQLISQTNIKRKDKVHFRYNKILKLIIQQAIKLKKLSTKTKKDLILECFQRIQVIDEDLFDYLLQAEGSEKNEEISQVLIKVVEKQSLRYITVSRLKSILKRMNLGRNIDFLENIKKVFRILRLLYWLTKKFNESYPTYLMQLNSSIKISNISKALMIIFSVDFKQVQVGRIIQFEINKISYDILIKYTEHEQLCTIEVIVQINGQQRYRQKKDIIKWSYILCMISLPDKKCINIFIDGADINIPLSQSSNEFKNIQFGPFSGAIKDVYILDRVYDVHEIHKRYFLNFRKLSILLEEMGEKSFIFTFDKGKVAEQSKWFWQKQMKVEYNNVNKLRSISFGQGIQQLGGIPALLYLVNKVVNSEKSEELTIFLVDFFQFLKLLIKESEGKVVQGWIKSSSIYLGQFIWLILRRNENLRGQKILFNRIFDFLGQFFTSSFQSQTIKTLRLQLLSDIYLNFEIWSICSTQIKMLWLTELSAKIDQKEGFLIYQCFNRREYEKILSSLVFFFQDEDVELGQQLYMAGIRISCVHDQISKLASKFCQLYNDDKIQVQNETVKKDLLLLMSLINSFFERKSLYFSKSQLSIIAILISHLSKNFVNTLIVQKYSEVQVYVFDHLTKLISESPPHKQIIYMLFDLCLYYMIDVQSIRNATAILLDRFTMEGKRKEDSLQFSYNMTMHIIKNIKILFEPTWIFSEEQMLTVMLGAIRNKKFNDQQKLSYNTITKDFDKFAFGKLKILFGLTEYCMIIKECIRDSDIFATVVFFLCIIIKNELLPYASSLAQTCLKLINDHFKKMAIGTQIESKENIIQDQANKMQQHEAVIEGDKNKDKDRSKRMSRKQQQTSQQFGSYQMKDKQNSQLSMRSLSGRRQNQQKAFENTSQINHSYSKLVDLFVKDDIHSLIAHCKSQELFQVYIYFFDQIIKSTQFKLPYKPIQNQMNDNFHTLFKASNLSLNQIIVLNRILGKKACLEDGGQKRNYQGIGNYPGKQEGQNILLLLLPLFMLQQVLSLTVSQQYKKGQEEQNLLIKAYIDILEVLEIRKIVQYSLSMKKSKNDLQKILKFQNKEKREKQLLAISIRITSQYNQNKKTTTSFVDQVEDIKEKLLKGIQVLNNSKKLKKMIEESKEILQTFDFAYNVFVSKGKNLNDEPHPNSMKKRKTVQSKKKKALQVSDEKEKQKYYEGLKAKLKSLIIRCQKQSRKKEELWKNLHQQNKFWVSTKIKNNQCYEIHPKITGYYRLNIVKTSFQEVPYPRRKSFGHQLEPNENQASLQSKVLNTQIFKTILSTNLSLEQNFQNNLISESQIRASQSNIDSKIPKDSIYAQYVSQRGVYAGVLYFSQYDQSFIFRCKGYASLPQDSIVYKYSTIFHRIQDLQFKIAIQINSRTQIYPRKYIHRHTAIEIFSNLKTYFFNLFFKDARDKFFKQYQKKVNCILDLRAQFERRKYTSKWKNGELDNFQYLMLINFFSGRTYNDLAQYPVMPWIIINYNPEQCEMNKEFLKNPLNMRDLSKPSGKLNSKKFQNLMMRCQEIDPEDRESKFLYGTMYSNPTVIYNFFIRLEPFTTLHWQHQGMRIDHADRLFSAVKDQFSTVITSTSDNKQLIPQFYYWPEFLKNRNKVNLGIKQNMQEVHDVRLPGWAKNPEQFIFKMRQALQSSDVSQNIHKWIDLIFGYKNPKEVALEHHNLFHYRTYEHDIFQTQQSEQAIKAAQITISQFGQIPTPLFVQAHPKKVILSSQINKVNSHINLLRKLNPKKIIDFELTNEGFFIFYGKQVQFYFVDASKYLGNCLEKVSKAYPCEGSNARLYDFNNNIWFTQKEGLFRIYDKNKIVLEIDTEMQCFCFFGRYIIYGFRSELIIVRVESNYSFHKVNSFYGHKNNIYKIEVNTTLDIILSLDLSGLVLIHEFSKQKLMRQFQLEEKDQVLDICIHQMGYFIFFTKSQKLIIYNFLGELFFSQDIGITNKAVVEQITKIAIFQQNRSLLLLGTDQGKIYLIDFLQIKRFNENCPYKEFTRFKHSLMDQYGALGGVLPIKKFISKRVAGKSSLTYLFYVLLGNEEKTEMYCFYSNQMVQQKIKKNGMLRQLGLFDSST